MYISALYLIIPTSILFIVIIIDLYFNFKKLKYNEVFNQFKFKNKISPLLTASVPTIFFYIEKFFDLEVYNIIFLVSFSIIIITSIYFIYILFIIFFKKKSFIEKVLISKFKFEDLILVVFFISFFCILKSNKEISKNKYLIVIHPKNDLIDFYSDTNFVNMNYGFNYEFINKSKNSYAIEVKVLHSQNEMYFLADTIRPPKFPKSDISQFFSCNYIDEYQTKTFELFDTKLNFPNLFCISEETQIDQLCKNNSKIEECYIRVFKKTLNYKSNFLWYDQNMIQNVNKLNIFHFFCKIYIIVTNLTEHSAETYEVSLLLLHKPIVFGLGVPDNFINYYYYRGYLIECMLIKPEVYFQNLKNNKKTFKKFESNFIFERRVSNLNIELETEMNLNAIKYIYKNFTDKASPPYMIHQNLRVRTHYKSDYNCNQPFFGFDLYDYPKMRKRIP